MWALTLYVGSYYSSFKVKYAQIMIVNNRTCEDTQGGPFFREQITLFYFTNILKIYLFIDTF